MIVGEGPFRNLQGGRRHVHLLAFERREDGSLRPGPLVGSLISAQPAAGQRGTRCTVVGVEHEEGGWRVTLAAGDVRDEVRLLARSPSRGYVVTHADLDEGKLREAMRGALEDEPEVLDEQWNRVVARHATTERAEERERREALERLNTAIAELERLAPQDRGRLQAMKAQARRLAA